MSKIDELTAFELNMAEKACDTPYEKLTEKDAPKSGLWAALAWVHRKRDEPTLTYDAYMKSVKPHEVMDYLFPDDEEAGEVDEDGFPDPDDGPALGGDEGESSGAAGAAEGGVLPGDGRPAE